MALCCRVLAFLQFLKCSQGWYIRHFSHIINLGTWWLVSTSPLMEAVRVQLYRMASSPNALPGPILPNTFPSFMTSNSPSAETYKWEPAGRKCNQFHITSFQLHKYTSNFLKELLEPYNLQCLIFLCSVFISKTWEYWFKVHMKRLEQHEKKCFFPDKI